MQRHHELATVWRLGVPLLCLAVHGCTEATGGSVVMSWALRSTVDREITDCAGGRIRALELSWTGEVGLDTQEFPCDARHGSTAFEIPPGSVTLSVRPACEFESGPRCLTTPTPCECVARTADPATFEAPAPLVREVVAGQTVTLDAVVVLVDADRICRLDLLCP